MYQNLTLLKSIRPCDPIHLLWAILIAFLAGLVRLDPLEAFTLSKLDTNLPIIYCWIELQ